MKIADKSVLVTGANRGIGQALVEEALRRGANVVLCLAVALVSWTPAATASTHLALDARSNASSLTVPGDNFFPESIAATPAGTLSSSRPRRFPDSHHRCEMSATRWTSGRRTFEGVQSGGGDNPFSDTDVVVLHKKG